MEKVAGEQTLLSSNYFHRCTQFKLTYVSLSSNGHTNLLFNARDVKLCHFDIFNMLFPFLELFKL